MTSYYQKTLVSWRIPDGLIDSALLVVSELVTNAIRALAGLNSPRCDVSESPTESERMRDRRRQAGVVQCQFRGRLPR